MFKCMFHFCELNISSKKLQTLVTVFRPIKKATAKKIVCDRWGDIRDYEFTKVISQKGN